MAANTTLQIIIQAKDEASKVFHEVGSETEGLGSKFKALAVGIGTAVAGFVSFRAIEGVVEKTTEMGEAIRGLSRETGLSAEASSQLIVALEKVGLNAEDAERGLGIFAKNLVNTRNSLLEGKNASTPFSDSLKLININAIGADGALAPFQKTLNEVADRFVGLANGEEKTALAMNLFGRSGRDLIPLLNLGSKGLKEAADEADRLGLTLSGANVEKIHNFVLAQRQMNEAISAVKLQIGLELMPVLTRFANWFTEHQGEIRRFVSDASRALSTFATDFKAGFDVIQAGLQWIPDNKGPIIAAIGAIGLALVLAFGPESLAVAGIISLITLLGVLKNKGRQPSGSDPRGDAPGFVPDVPRDQMQAALDKSNADWLQKVGGMADVAATTSLDLSALGRSAKAVGSQLESAFDQLLGQPTQEQARLRLQLDRLEAQGPRQIDLSINGGRSTPSITAQNDLWQKQYDAQINSLRNQINQEDAKTRILKDEFTVANHLLLTDQQRDGIARALITQESNLTTQTDAAAGKFQLNLNPALTAATTKLNAFTDALPDLANFVNGIRSPGATAPSRSGLDYAAAAGMP